MACLVPSALASGGIKRPHTTPAAADAVEVRALTRLRSFTDWLSAGSARGFVGEIGWPGNPAAAGDPRWNAVARSWYRAAERAHLWVTAWATGEIWSSTYKLAIYRAPAQYASVEVANPQAAVIQEQKIPTLRGINVEQGAFGEFGAGFEPNARTSPLSSGNVGRYGATYSYPGRLTYSYLARQGISFVRLAFRWERLQRRPGGPLDAVELGRLEASIAAAGAAGLEVILDCHNYGGYYLMSGNLGRRLPIGSPVLPESQFAAFWRRLSAALAGNRAVLGYGLMNEPVGMGSAAVWESASQRAVTAIRASGDRKRIFVSSYGWGGVVQFARFHAAGPWIRDPARSTWYEAHHYFDSDMSSAYRLSYDQELVRARSEGF